MTPNWIRDHDVTPTPRDIEAVAAVLEGQHGKWAAEIADFFADCHEQRGDVGRCWAWLGVADLVRERERARNPSSCDAPL
jgi:hypothetical protein